MTINIEKLRAEMRWETRKFAVLVAVAYAAVLAAGVAIGRFVVFHQ
jgi:hypothetical protein